MSGRFPWLKVTAAIGGCLGVGYVLMRVVTPTPEQLYEKMSPAVRRKVDESRMQRLAAENVARQQASIQAQAATSDPGASKATSEEQRK